jgi:Rod binding domain-containing protein
MEPDEVFGGGHGEEMWRSMLNQEYGKEVAKSGRLGIADNVTKAMLKMQEERTKAAEEAAQGGAALPATASPDFKPLQNDPNYMPLNAQAAAAYMSLNTGASTFRTVKGH